MAKRSTRNKIRLQVAKAFDNIGKAQGNLAYAAALAEDRHPDLNKYLPEIMVSLETVRRVTEDLYDIL